MEPETRSSILAKVAYLDEQIQELIDLGEKGFPGWLLESNRDRLPHLHAIFREKLDDMVELRDELYSQYLESAEGNKTEIL